MAKRPDFGAQVRAARVDAGYESSSDLSWEIAKLTGKRISRQTVSNWEVNSHLPGALLFAALCSLTGKAPSFFFGKEFVFRTNHRRQAAKRVAA